ncbi:hypothetical protein EDB89DRAFT_742980 [Lactarius sanguifluus]|nr:hypothetical protein EDB89DRAFT_742980 [Lactarius sanguifluus]
MQEPFPSLTRLGLGSIDGNTPVLPDAFLGGSAPRLQNIYLTSVPFPVLPKLLSSTSDLVQLRLVRIPETGYISPEAMVASLAALTRLKTLWILFRSPTSRPSPRRPPPLIRNILPALTEFTFRGVSEYLEDFMAQIDTPRLKDLKISYYNQLDFQVPQFSQFFRRQEILDQARLDNVLLKFSHHNTRIKLTSSYRPYFSPGAPAPSLDLEILSEGLDWQTSHMTQVLRQCFVVLIDVDHLSIGNGFPWPYQHDGLDDTEWLELLSLFTAVKSLILSEEKAGYISRGFTSEMTAEPLPSLRLLHILPESPTTAPVGPAISLHRLSSQPITIVDTEHEFNRLRSLLVKGEKVPGRSLT